MATFALNIMAAVGELERERIKDRGVAGFAAKKSGGERISADPVGLRATSRKKVETRQAK